MGNEMRKIIATTLHFAIPQSDNYEVKMMRFIKPIIWIALFVAITFAQTTERSKVKKLYETKGAKEEMELYENATVTDEMLKNFAKNKATEECNAEISKQSGGGFVISAEPIHVIINRCIQKKSLEKLNRKPELRKEVQKVIQEGLDSGRKLLSLQGCREVAEKDEECTDDLIVKFDRFGNCICETY
ncbi:hypothetical protein AGMMS49938_17900 [Fibrobacterales bacterium]|nr:hypothetical protein AGMMS49938_17900 [Fibrobacterales bacterium]